MNKNLIGRGTTRMACGLLVALLVSMAAQGRTVSPVGTARTAAGDADFTDRIIVKLKPAYRGERTMAMPAERARLLGAVAGTTLAPVRAMSGDAQVLRLPRALRVADVQVIVERIARDPSVQSAFVDAREHLMAVPNDPLFNQQDYLQAPGAAPRASAANAPGAWDITRGTGAAVVAVVDGGARFDHPDLAGRLLQGYDFIAADCTIGDPGCTVATQYTTANDGNGRDPDASDPGDWVTAADKAGNPVLTDCDVEDSTWHGTHIAGIIGASGNNGVGITGLNWNATLLVVRVSGRCGAYRSDVVDGMRWAAGLNVPNVPDNPRPARIINISLGSTGACTTSAYGQAITDILATGAVIVAAAGNGDADVIQPANCPGVISVGAVRGDGARTTYSNTGSGLTIVAPAGDYYSATNDRLLSTSNAGTTTPLPYSSAGYYTALAGTSFSTPVVTGTVSLMLSINPNLTSAQVIDVLRSTARAFTPVAGLQTCVAGGTRNSGNTVACNCTTAACGAGYVDTAAAVARANALANPAPTPAPVASDSGGGGGGSVGLASLMALLAIGLATGHLRRPGSKSVRRPQQQSTQRSPAMRRGHHGPA